MLPLTKFVRAAAVSGGLCFAPPFQGPTSVVKGRHGRRMHREGLWRWRKEPFEEARP